MICRARFSPVLEIKVPSKVLNFCPTPTELNTFEVINDIREFGRRMTKETRLETKSSWNPEIVRSPLYLFLKGSEEKILSIKTDGINYVVN